MEQKQGFWRLKSVDVPKTDIQHHYVMECHRLTPHFPGIPNRFLATARIKHQRNSITCILFMYFDNDLHYVEEYK